MIKFRAWYMPFGKYGAMQEMVYSRASHILALAEMEPEKYIPEQFTGLTDVNGKDIYEGDLVRLADDLDNPYKVIFDEAKFEFSGSRFCYDLGEAFMDYEVIGNVHENPELLEVRE